MSLTFPTETDKIAPALVKALGALQEPGRAGKAHIAGRAGYTYMTLPDLLGAVRAAFAEQQLAVMQSHNYDDGWTVVRTLVLHESGQMVVTEPLTIRCQADAQSIGSAGTYAKRYQLAALVGLAGDDDDDGEHATRSTPPTQTPGAARQPSVSKAQAQTRARDQDAPAAPGPPRPVLTEPPGGFLNGSPARGSASPPSVKYLWTLLRGLGTDEAGIRTWVAQQLQIDDNWSTKDLSQQQVSVLINRLKQPAAQPGDTTPPEEAPDGPALGTP